MGTGKKNQNAWRSGTVHIHLGNLGDGTVLYGLGLRWALSDSGSCGTVTVTLSLCPDSVMRQQAIVVDEEVERKNAVKLMMHIHIPFTYLSSGPCPFPSIL